MRRERDSALTEKKANHQANIVRIETILPHTNADNLEIIKVGEYQVVSRKGQFVAGSLGVYIQPDSVVPVTEPFKFIWEQYKCVDPNDPNGFTVPEKRRRITVRNLRGEWSEGLLLPVSDFTQIGSCGCNCGTRVERELPGEYLNACTKCHVVHTHTAGDDVSDLLGITHYDPDTEISTKGTNSGAPKIRRKRYPKTLRGWWSWLLAKVLRKRNERNYHEENGLGIPVYDVDAFKSLSASFQEQEQVIVTEKVHGSNARYIYLDGVMYAGSRQLWKSADSNCIYRKNLVTNPWIVEWCKAHEGYVLWGEVTPTQGGYKYGSDNPQFFVFDMRTPEGKWLDESTPEGLEILTHLQAHSVPVLYKGPYLSYDNIKQFVDGPSKVPGAKNIREGVVVKTAVERSDRNGRLQRKIVSNVFLDKDTK